MNRLSFKLFGTVSLCAAALLLSTAVDAQEMKTVTGTVVDDGGSPIAGATVIVDGTTTGTVTDADGNYSITAPSDATLVASFIGYESAEQAVKDRNVIEFQLYDELTELDELIVIGYGTQKRSDLTGAVTQVKSEDIVLTPSANPMESLQGKVAGLDITKSSGQAGSGVTMQLRGTRSFTASGNPSFIIDGLPGDYATLNPNDIESIEILKDASSTAVYGSAGANGVVLITTKSGQKGKTTVSLNAYVGFNGWSKLPEMRSGETYLQAIRDAQATAGMWESTADDEKALDAALGDGAWQDHLDGNYIDWAKELLRTATVQNYSLSVSGGTDKTKGYLSFNFNDERGQYDNDNNKIYSSNIRLDYEVRKWLAIGVNTQLAYVYRNAAYAKLDKMLIMEPLGKIYDEEGKINERPSPYSTTCNVLVNNPSNYRNNRQNFRLNFNPYIEIRPLEGLTLLSRLHAGLTFNRTNKFEGIGSYNFLDKNGKVENGPDGNVYAQIDMSRTYNYKWENVLTYNFKVAELNDFTLTAVTSWNHNQSDNTSQKETNVSDNAFLWHNMGVQAAEKTTVGSSYSMSKGLGFVGRLAYSHAGKYLASVSVRHDGSSRLSKDYQWDTFPAFSLGWRLSEEEFMEPAKDWLTNLKIRFGYGVSGTANINPYATVSSLEPSTMSFSGDVVDIYRFSREYTNKKLGWEKSYNTNVGLDLNLLGGRIDLNADIYRTKTKDVIWRRELPISSGGYTSSSRYVQFQNICETKNNGIEISLATTNIRNKDIQWKSSVTFSANKEEITKLIDGETKPITNANNTALALGEAINSYYDYKFEGIWQIEEAADAAVFGCEPGDIKVATNLRHLGEGKYEGEDEDGNIVNYDAENKYTYDDKDYRILGHNTPDWNLGFKNELKWRGFDLSVFMFWRYGQTIKYDMLTNFDPKGKANFPASFNYWTPTNASNDFPAANANKKISDYRGYTSLAFVDGSYFKIKNITLGFSFPKNTVSKMGLTSCRIYGTINNPFVKAKSKRIDNYDPEQNGDMNYPLTKQLVVGLNIKF